MLLVEINFLWRLAYASPSMVVFEVCVLFQAHQQDRGVFYETDLFLCGLWLSSHSCSITNEEWGQAKGCLHGCSSQYVTRHSRAAENICVHMTGLLARVPDLPYMASFTSNQDTFCSLWRVWYRNLVWVNWLSLLSTSKYSSWHYPVRWCENNFHLAS